MSFITLAIVNSVLTSIEAALQEGHEVDHGVLGSFNAGISHLLLSGREPSSVEVAALQSLAAAIVVQPETESDAEVAIEPPVLASEPSSDGGEVAPSLPPEDTALDAGASEPASGAAGDAEASQASVTPGSEEAAPQSEPAGAAEALAFGEPLVLDKPVTGDELFQEQSHGEDDGA